MPKIKVEATFKRVSTDTLPTDRHFSHIRFSGVDGAGTPFEDSADGNQKVDATFTDVSPGKFVGIVESIDDTGAPIEGTGIPFEFTVREVTPPEENTFPVAANVSVTQLPE